MDTPALTRVHRVLCEYDIGQKGVAFTSTTAAREWAHSNPVLIELAHEFGQFDEGVLGFEFSGDLDYYNLEIIS